MTQKLEKIEHKVIHYDEMRRVLLEFVTDVEAVGVAHVTDQWPDLATTYHHAKRVLAEDEGDSHA